MDKTKAANELASSGSGLIQPALVTLLNNLPGMAYRCLFDAQRTMLIVSEGCLDLTGYKSDDLINNQEIAYADLIFLEDRAAVIQEIKTAIAEERSYRCFYRIKIADDQERWVLDKGKVLFSSAGIVEALEGFITDFSEGMAVIESLEQRVADHTRKLSALYDILEAVSEPTDINTTINRALRRALKAVKGNAGAIHLLDENGVTLQLVAQKDLPDAAARKLAKIDIQKNMRAGWIVRNNEPLFIPKMSVDARAVDLATSSGLEVYTAVPIVVNEQVLGVLTILSDARSFQSTKEEMELLISVGEQLGMVVENARLRKQTEQLIVMEERNRLARELHDSVTQSLYSLTLFAEAGINLALSGENERAGPLFTDILQTGQQALKEMRLLVHKLRPSILQEEGLIQALQHRLNAVEGRAGVKHQLIVEGSLDLDNEVEEAIFYIVQEALNNALKHASASEVTVTIQQNEHGTLALTIQDDGRGFDPQTTVNGSGLGLTSMRERVEKFGGAISYHSAIGKGTKIQIEIPPNLLGGNDA